MSRVKFWPNSRTWLGKQESSMCRARDRLDNVAPTLPSEYSWPRKGLTHAWFGLAGRLRASDPPVLCTGGGLVGLTACWLLSAWVALDPCLSVDPPLYCGRLPAPCPVNRVASNRWIKSACVLVPDLREVVLRIIVASRRTPFGCAAVAE